MIDVRRLGRVSYEDGLALQADLVEQRRAGGIPDTLLLLEHPPVITLGVKTRRVPNHIVAGDAELAALGVTVHDTGRGGDVTYHGPGQLVGYPILDLAAMGDEFKDVRRYVRDIEEVMIRVIAAFGITAFRVSGLTGVWTGPPDRQEKVGAIGIRISRWVTSHGFALNVDTNLDHFGLIVPCGIADKGVTSLSRLTGRTVTLDEAEAVTARVFRTVFDGRGSNIEPA